MLTNVFRLGGLRQISWFQLIPADGDGVSPSERWPSDHLTTKVLNAHIKLQNEGHLSAWTTNDTSGSYGGSIVKLWLFIPGRNETINTTLQSAVTGLKVIASGLWSFPKDRSEVAYALCQALRNRMERGLRSVGYMRFGDVFVKCRSFAANESQLRRPLPTCEVAFTVSEEAIFVHFVLQRKRVRSLSTDDIQAALKLQHDGSADEGESQAVMVAPHGLRGKLTGCYSSDLVHVLYESKTKAVNDHLEPPLHMASSCYHGISSASGVHAEVSFGHESHATPAATMKISKSRGLHTLQNSGRNGTMAAERDDRSCTKSSHQCERTLLYPPEAVLVPLVPAVPARIFLKRCWLQRWVGTTWIEDELHAGPKTANSYGSWGKVNDERLDSLHASTNVSHGMKSPSNKSCSSSTSSSGGSSIENSSSHGSSTSDTDGEAGIAPGELEADAESLVVKGKQTHVSSRQLIDDEIKGFEDVSAIVKWGQSGGTTQGEAPVLKATKRSSSSGGEVSNDVSRSLQNRADAGVSGMVLSPNVGLGTPKAASSQVGTPWDWPEDDRGLNMGIENDADILAEFGDFGDFFEDDGLYFGEPPGTAESQAMMFPLTDCMDGISSPGNGCLDFSDPMLLPILDIPALEGLEQQPSSAKDFKASGFVSGLQELQESVKTPDVVPDSRNAVLDSLPKVEAVLLLAPGYEPVSFPSGRDVYQHSVFKSPYLPGAKKAHLDGTGGSDLYVYGATPPPSPKAHSFERKREHYEIVSDRAVFNGKRLKTGGTVVKYLKEKSTSNLHAMVGRFPTEKPSLLGRKMSIRETAWTESGACIYGGHRASDQTPQRRFPTTILATEVDCFLLQLAFLQVSDAHLCKNVATAKPSSGSMKEVHLDSVFSSDSSTFAAKVGVTNQQERKKKDRIPSRIAGDVDEKVHDGPRVSEVGVWRPVGTPKQQSASHSSWNESTQTSSGMTSMEPGVLISQENASSNMRPNHWQELLDTLPLLIQQASIPFDVAFDGDCGDGPFGWLTSQEQERHKSVCGPGTIHAGCGGMLCASHFLDNAGVELLDPLASEISAALVATILQSDIRVAMATAFGDAHLDGPLSLGEWLRGRAFLSDSFGTDSAPSDLKETASTVTVGIGEPITPPQCMTGPPGMKTSVQDIESQPCDGHRSSSSWAMDGSSLSDDGCTRRCGQETGLVETDAQPSSCRGGPTVMALPMPSLLVGYQDDWLKVSSSTLHLWEKAPFEPYATAKPVTYYVVCPRIDSLLSATADYLQQLSCVYEACRLGTHVAGNMVFGQTSFPPTTGKHAFSGFVAADFPSQASQQHGQSNALCPLSQYAMSFNKIWNFPEFQKALSKACKSLPVSASSTAQREPENGPCLVYYVICPSSDPDAVLQTMLVACQSIGRNIAISDKQRRASISSQMQRTSAGLGFVEDTSSVPSQGIIGFSTSKLVLQVLTAETILKSSRPISVDMDSLKEVAFSVYNKIRRIPRMFSSSDLSLHATQPGRGRPLPLQTSTAMSAVWKDCGTGRSSVSSTALPVQDSLLESSAFRSNSWDIQWQQQGISHEPSTVDGGHHLHDTSRHLFEPLFILAEPGTLDHGVGFSASRFSGFDDASGSVHPGPSEAMHGTVADSGSDFDITGGGTQKVANLHCCYGWTEDWQWLISVWTDARGELLDVHLFPVSSGGGRWESKGLHSLFVQVLMHGCQLLLMATGTGSAKLRAMVITRVGAFFELECQEWQKAVFTVGGMEVRKWPVQIWQQPSDSSCVVGSSSSLQPQDVSTLVERTMTLGGGMPSSPGPSSSVFMSRNKPSNFVKTELGSSVTRKQGGISHGHNDACRGAFHLVQSVSFVNIMLDHSLQMVGLNDIGSQSGAGIGGSQNVVSSSWLNSSSANVLTALGTGVGLVKTLASTAASYMFVPAHGLRFMSTPLQLPTCGASESPAIEQLLRKSGLATTLASAFIVSRTIPSIRTELMHSKFTEEWPSTLFVGLVGHMSSFTGPNSQQGGLSASLGNDAVLKAKLAKPMHTEGCCDHGSEAHLMVEMIAAELQALSWLTVSPAFPFRRTALPFHCHVLQRLRRLLQYADTEVSGLYDV